jgi:type IV fimbrial biogenesis protein FimT
MIATNRLATQTNDMIAALNVTRSEAIRRNRTIRLCSVASETADTCAGGAVDTNWKFWVVGFTDASSSPSKEVVLRRGLVTNDDIVMRTTYNGASLAILPTGLPASAGQIKVCTKSIASENRRVIDIGAGNIVEIERETGTCP